MELLNDIFVHLSVLSGFIQRFSIVTILRAEENVVCVTVLIILVESWLVLSWISISTVLQLNER